MPDEEYDLNYAYRALLILAPIAIAVMYTEAMLIPSLPTIANDFNVNSATVSWVLTAYLISGVVANPIVGKLGDIYGKKRILVYVMMIYTIAVTLNGFAPNFTLFIIFRTIQGIGLGMFPLAFSLIREEFPPHLVPRAQGLVSAMFGIGSAISLPIAATVAQDIGWQYNYHFVIPFVILLTYLTSKYIKESRYVNPNTKIDYIGAGILGSSLALMTTAFSEAPTWGWLSTSFLITMLLGVVLFTTFIFYELRIPYPLISIKLLKEKNVLASNIAAFVAGFGIFMAYQAITYLLELPNPVGFNLDILSTGITMLPVSLSQMVGALFASRLILRSGTKFVIVISSVILSFFYFILSLIAISGSSAGLINVVLFSALATLGASMLNVVLINILTFSVERRVLGIATGMNTVFRLIGGAFGPSIAGSLISTYYTYLVYPMSFGGNSFYLPIQLPSDYAFQLTFTISALAGLMMAIIGSMTRDIRIGKMRVGISSNMGEK
ncbi:MFS transporter [Sulfolobus sp. A20]|uniref:MFS transporter n=2 Tax=Sulfolobaceae TaxID=118883 RepID=UPI0008462078|nr:MFS transporter [Sulfolobus sp. A20]TRM75707.1 MFS transporter [Sulfolobus sp. A20-N-F8]TRM77126.1 MFS transporter [Sulfolobus sp. B5]TRM81357.1 MFS transporter [Sulfolobus sp. D5]TRM87175.1 MFS transporter [Sulfolobus sp. C3]TRM87305.1 MFS transporter [Sulfolobus sp. E3]TRN03010.1 MFS transporter [Sulfolobus sp. F1]TRN04815.1 MFS transporter [Sulfolobus sp. E1]